MSCWNTPCGFSALIAVDWHLTLQIGLGHSTLSVILSLPSSPLFLALAVQDPLRKWSVSFFLLQTTATTTDCTLKIKKANRTARKLETK